jgi:hypothetical protein
MPAGRKAWHVIPMSSTHHYSTVNTCPRYCVHMSATSTQQIDSVSDCITTDNPNRQIPIDDNFVSIPSLTVSALNANKPSHSPQYLHLPMGFLRILEAKKSRASAIVYCQQLGACTTGKIRSECTKHQRLTLGSIGSLSVMN